MVSTWLDRLAVQGFRWGAGNVSMFKGVLMLSSHVRSLLFAPGSRPELFAKASSSAADAVILDLEDAVPEALKDVARQHVAMELATRTDRLTFIRINHPERGQLAADLAVLAPHANQVIMVPKVSELSHLEEIDRALTAFEKKLGFPRDGLGIVPVVETALGVRNLFDILSRFPRVRGAGLASAEQGDLMIDLGGQWTPAGEAMNYARGKFVCDGRAARAQWLIDGAFMNIADEAALETETQLARVMGFTGKVAIHPRQLATINRVFSPTAAEAERAKAVIAAFREAEATGRAAVKVRGMMVDYANVRWAEQVLEFSGDNA